MRDSSSPIVRTSRAEAWEVLFRCSVCIISKASLTWSSLRWDDGLAYAILWDVQLIWSPIHSYVGHVQSTHHTTESLQHLTNIVNVSNTAECDASIIWLRTGPLKVSNLLYILGLSFLFLGGVHNNYHLSFFFFSCQDPTSPFSPFSFFDIDIKSSFLILQEKKVNNPIVSYQNRTNRTLLGQCDYAFSRVKNNTFISPDCR